MGPFRALPAFAAMLCTLHAAPRSDLADGYTRRVWQTQDGLPENTVQALAQTPDNYLWIGTSGGLVRFDGAGFTPMPADNTRAPHEDSIFYLTSARDGSLWAGTDGTGLLRYRNGTIRSYGAPEGLTNGFVRVVYEDHGGAIWAGTDNGLFRLKGERFVRVDGSGRVPALSVHAIREDRAGNLWVGGSRVLRIRGPECTEFPLEGEDSVRRVKSILETPDGTIWVGTVSGLQRMRAGAGEGTRFERVKEIASTVRALLVDRSGVLWIGSIGEGLMLYADGRFSRVTASDGPPSSTVLALFEDSERNIWVGLQTGLLRLSRTAMSTFPLPGAANADFGSIYADRDGSLWVAGTHLYRINSRHNRSEVVEPPVPGVRVRTVFRDRSGALWIGTEGAGVFRSTGGSRVQYTRRNGLVNDFIRAFLESRDGSIWIGTDEGLSRWRQDVLTNYGEHEGLAYFSIRTLLEDSRGDIWIGTERGVSHWRHGVFVQDEVSERLRAEKVWAIHEDRDGGLWFGTRGAGLFRWRGGRMRALGTADGLASNSIYQILEDARGTFWMSGPNGVSAVSRADLDGAADHRGARPAVTLYGLSDSVEATQMYGGVAPAGCVTAGEEVWFPSNRGPVHIAPDRAQPESVPNVIIQGVQVDGRDAPVASRLVVPPGEGRLQIGYGAVRLRSQERLRFRYMLEGFDHDWTEALRERVAYYTNLPPGHYRFRVQAFEMNRPQSLTEVALPIEWQPHFYRTFWFAVLCSATLLAAVFGAHRVRLRQVHGRFLAVLEERNRVAREMHDTVIQGGASVSALLEAVASMEAGEAACRRELLDCARTQVRLTVDEARRAVWNLRQEANHPLEMQTLLEQIGRQVGHASQVSIRVETSGKAVHLDPAVEHDILMVAREATTNAVRHARPREVRLRMDFESGYIRLVVADDGCGFHPEEVLATRGEHFGLIGMRERIERLGGQFRVSSEPGKGTSLSAQVPVRSAADARLGIGWRI